MGKRSLKASPEGQVKARQTFERTRWTQEQLAFEVGLSTRQSVWKFLSGRPIERHIFIDLCFRLNLEWEDIADLPKIPKPTTAEKAAAPSTTALETKEVGNSPIAWEQKLREHLQPSLAKQCGVIQSSLDRGVPLPLEKLYTPIRIVPHLRSQQWLEVNELQPADSEQRVQLAQTYAEAVDAMEIMQQTPKVLLLGKPGAGKTTFLQHLANQCMGGHYLPERVPIFIPLRHGLFSQEEDPTAETSPVSLIDHLLTLFQGTELSKSQLQQLLQQGRFFLLMDGLDEVPPEHSTELLQEIQSFTQKYANNHCVITSRLTSDSPYLQGFLDVEVDDFSRDQIQVFARQWFTANLPAQAAAQLKTDQFLEALDLPENQPLKELMGTPILLSLLCSVFLARSNFPKQRAKLYQAGLDILLQRWDKARGIQRDQAYYSLSAAEKLKLLGTLAASTFEKGHYFFEKSELLDTIADYLQGLNNRKQSDLDLESCYLESEAILHAIQVQHGLLVERAKEVYSFSHLTFQEYLTARKILYQDSPDAINQTIQDLAAHTLENQWHEVLKLTANMMTVADPLIKAMHGEIQTLLQSDPECQQYLQAIEAKVSALDNAHHPAAMRAFYFTLFGDRDLRLANALDSQVGQTQDPDLSLDLTLARSFETGRRLVQAPDIKSMLNLIFSLELDQKFTLSEGFKTELDELKQQLPAIDSAPEALSEWWTTSGHPWLEQFQMILTKHRHIGQAQGLSAPQKQRLNQYYQLNLLLTHCCQESQVSKAFGQTLMSSLLLP